MTNEQIVVMSNINKSFVGVPILKDVSIEINKGEVYGLIGENGAGKSTLMKILAGIYNKDSGVISIRDQEVNFKTALDGVKNGISFIHQELMLIPQMSIARNIFLGNEIKKGLLLDLKEMNKKAREIVQSIGLDIDVETKVSDISVAQQQMVEICRAISFGADIIIMDEPTSSLTDAEIELLFKKTRELVARGVTVVFISHKLTELMEICDRVTVLRDGELIKTMKTADTTIPELIQLIVGRNIDQYYSYIPNAATNKTILEVKNFNNSHLKNVNFSLKKGEVLGFAGLVGAGRSELAKAIFGIDRLVSGELLIRGQPVKILSPRTAINHRLALIPEDRKVQGLFVKKDIRFNISITIIDMLRKHFKIYVEKEVSILEKYSNQLKIKMSGYSQICSSLSGGNQQKVSLAKWMATEPEIIILDEPTRGIDVGAKTEIYKIITQMAESGKTIIMISSELPELLNTCNRIAVMREGEIINIVESGTDKFNQETIMRYATLGEKAL